MNRTANNIALFTSSTSRLNAGNDDLTSTKMQVRVHEPLLYKIAVSFGFNESKSQELVKQVCTGSAKHSLHQVNAHSEKIDLVKSLVHQCIFIISSRLFSQSNFRNQKDQTGFLASYYTYINKQAVESQEMPLSFRAVFILKNIIGFDEREIAAILNTTPFKVRERFSKALVYLHKNQLK